MRYSIPVFCCAMLAMPASAQTRIDPDAFLDKAVGNTLTFEHYPDGGVVGVEQFLSRTRTVWATPVGICTYGRVEVRDNQLCFIYEDLPVPEHCWVTFDDPAGMIVMSGLTSIQRVTKITRRPVICEDAPMS